ncbi:MAG: tRNA uridine-5-carboxymethylaminomethyl(34) synthesis GTPase MnmE [Lachnospiraceae bacterium]|nr:tRNA uridine-5-carboxymethylaminomethyl(34) synthesis GTPase MnmE [Lachnospiraceae bacterium]
MSSLTDTIAAVSTAQAPAGIGIVRISGPEAIAVADRLYAGKNEKKLADQKGNTIHYGWIKDGDKEIDEALAVVLRAPHSYTGEDTVEIDCHGGILAVNSILSAALKCGARIAEPGEFTKRAFLNGRIDLSRAEAVMDLISAKSRYALESSVSQLKGSVFEKVSGIRDELMNQLAFIESALDDPEHYSMEGQEETIRKTLEEQSRNAEKLIASFDQGRYIGGGIKTVILGKPNAGKSSLLNAMMGTDRAIVTDEPGTTRDVLRETIQLDGFGLELIDTAGIRKSENKVEKIGIERSREETDNADLVLYVVDSSRELDESDREILSMISGKQVIVIFNKSDLEEMTSENDIKEICSYPILKTSAKEGSGIGELKEYIKETFFRGELSFNDEVYITNIRHKTALEEARVSLLNAKEALEAGIPEDVYAIDLFGAISSLDSIIGGNVSEDLVNTIFEKFCMGK